MPVSHLLRRTRFLLLGLLVLSAASLIGAQSAKQKLLVATPVATAVVWHAPQFFQADERGNVFLLRGDTLDVYPVANGGLDEPTQLQDGGVSGGELSAAAMSPDGSRWILAFGANRIVLYEDQKQKSTPEPGWFVTAVGVQRDQPVLGVLPMSIGHPEGTRRPASPPLLLKYDGRGWETHVETTFPRHPAKQQDPINGLFADRTLRIVPDVKGKIWVAYPYTGRITHLTPGGKSDLELVIRKGEAEFRKDDAEIQARFQERLRREGSLGKGSAGLFTAKLALRGMASRDGSLYFVLAPSVSGRESILARYDPVRSIVEGAPLRVGRYEGELSMAAGKEALFLAAVEGADGRWQLAWEQIDQAPWEVLDIVKIAGGRDTEPAR